MVTTTGTRASPTLVLPLLQSEQDPTATDLRAVQSWGQRVPSLLLNNVSIGSVPPLGTTWINILDSVIQTTTAGGEISVEFSTYNIPTFSYGYLVNAWPGDIASSLVATVPDLTNCNLTEVVIACYNNSGTVVTGTVRVNIQILGA